MRRNVLIFHSGALGDFVLTWPLAIAVGRLLAQSRVLYVTRAGHGELAERVLNVEWRDAEAGWHPLHHNEPGGVAALPDGPRKALAGAQLIFAYAAVPSSVWEANVRSIAGDVPVTWIAPNPPAGAATHVTRHQLDQFASQPAVRSFAEQALQLVATRGVMPNRKIESGLIVLAPGSGSESKNWPTDRYADLAGRLLATGRRVRVILGETELETWPAARQTGWPAGVEIARCLSAPALLDAIVAASVFVGNDSGPTHLAAALGVPTVALFGPTDPAVWHPLGPVVRIAAGDWGNIRVEDVEALLEAVRTPKPS